VSHQNLGDWKHDGSDPIMRYSDVVKEGDVSLDLIIANTTAYSSASPQKNGAHNAAGMVQVNVDGASSVGLHMTFVKSGTDEPYIVGAFLLTIFDFDQAKTKKKVERGIESVRIGGFSQMWLHDDNEVDVQDLGKGVFIFKSLVQDVPGGTNNPTDVLHLTEEQKKIAVGLRFDQRTGVDMNLSVKGGGYGRNIFFAGASSMQCDEDANHPIFNKR